MAAMTFSSVFSVPSCAFTQVKPKSSENSSWVCSPSMAFHRPSHLSSFGSSKSAFVHHGFSFQSPNLSGFLRMKSRSSGNIYARAATEKTLYDFTVKDIDRNDVPLSKFKGKVLLIVNVASKCGLTSSNYSELSHLYEKYKTQGFEILAFPCNQFGGQEPGSNPEIKNFACTRFKAEFPIFDKVDVNGPSTAPVYQFLKSSAGGFFGDLIKWNFEKFLVDKMVRLSKDTHQQLLLSKLRKTFKHFLQHEALYCTDLASSSSCTYRKRNKRKKSAGRERPMEIILLGGLFVF